MSDGYPIDPRHQEHSRRHLARRRKLILWGLAALLLVVAWFAVPPAYNSLKSMRARSFFEHGQEFMSLGQWTNALDRFELAMQMDPEQTQFRAAVAKASEKVSPSLADRAWASIMRAVNSTSEERQDYVEFLLAGNRLEPARLQIRSLMNRKPPEARSLFLASEYFRMRGDYELALAHARRALVAAPDEDRFQLQYANLLMASDSPEEKAEGRKLLWELCGRVNPKQIDAWKRFSGQPDLKPREATQLVQWLDASPAVATNAILRANLLWVADGAAQSRRDALIADTINRSPVTNGVVLLELLSWLNFRKAHDATLGLVPESRLGTNFLFYQARFDALVGLQRWNEAETLLQRTNLPATPVFRLAMSAHVRTLRGDAAGAAAQWTAALRESTNNFIRTMELVNIAQSLGRDDIALRALAPYLTPAVQSTASFLANQRAHAIYRNKGDLRAARDALGRTLVGGRTDDRTKVEILYLNLLINQEVRQTLDSCVRELRTNPERHEYRVLTALAHVRMDDPATGLQVMSLLPGDARSLPAQFRAVAMTVYRVNGKVKEWTDIAETLSNSGFNKHELQALQSISK